MKVFLGPFTVIQDWNADFYEKPDPPTSGEQAEIYHVWASNPDDASDVADELAASRWGAWHQYLRPIAVLRGYASFCDK